MTCHCITNALPDHENDLLYEHDVNELIMKTATAMNSRALIGMTNPIMSMREALSHGVTLDEAERRLDMLIHNHYHPKK